MFDENETPNLDPSVVRIQTATSNTDYEFKANVYALMSDRVRTISSIQDDESQATAAELKDMQKTLDRMGNEETRKSMPVEDVACALADVSFVMGRFNPNNGGPHSPENSERYDRAKKVFMKAGEMLWPGVTGSEDQFGISRARLAANQDLIFSPVNNVGEDLSGIGAHEDGHPPSSETRKKRIDESLSQGQERVGEISWDLLLRNQDGELAKGGRITTEQKGKIASTLKDFYTIEMYKDRIK